MNRKQRRTEMKRSKDATPDEIFPGRNHRPIQGDIHGTMNTLAEALKDIFPGFDFTLFVAERHQPSKKQLPRFNYISTCDREDMIAVLKAFIAKNEVMAEDLDKINEPPPTSTKQ